MHVSDCLILWFFLYSVQKFYASLLFKLWSRNHCALFRLLSLRAFGWLRGKESACQCRRHSFNPRVRKIPWRREWQPTPVFLPQEFHGQKSLAGYSPWDHKMVGHNLARPTRQQQLWAIAWTCFQVVIWSNRKAHPVCLPLLRDQNPMLWKPLFFDFLLCFSYLYMARRQSTQQLILHRQKFPLFYFWTIHKILLKNWIFIVKIRIYEYHEQNVLHLG